MSDMPDKIFAYYMHKADPIGGLVDCYIFDSKSVDTTKYYSEKAVNKMIRDVLDEVSKLAYADVMFTMQMENDLDSIIKEIKSKYED